MPKFGRFIFLLAAIVLLGLTARAEAYKNPYPLYLNGDKNYVLCAGQTGVAWYIDRSSLNVEKYEPPHYLIAVNVCAVSDADKGKTTIGGVRTFRFRYDYERREMYNETTDKEWHCLNPYGPTSERICICIGETAFFLAYDMKFYGSKFFYNPYLKTSEIPISDNFYQHIEKTALQ